MLRAAFLFVFCLGALVVSACGTDAVTDPPPASDDCTSQGPLYECHPNPTCNAEYMPLSGISCGAKGGTCCLKGALPPGDASTDG